jgi:hypothetical protein
MKPLFQRITFKPYQCDKKRPTPSPPPLMARLERKPITLTLRQQIIVQKRHERINWGFSPAAPTLTAS